MIILILNGALFLLHCWNLVISFEGLLSCQLLLQARNLLKKEGEEVPIEVLNNLGVLHFERGEFEVCAVLQGYL